MDQIESRSNHSPTVSILLAVYNCEMYLRETLESLLGQTFKDFEIVAIDDASSDGTHCILETYASRDLRIRVTRNHRNLGLGPSLNRGLAICRADLVARADGDDIYLPDRLRKQIDFMRTHPAVGVCSTGFQWIDEAGNCLGDYPVPEDDAIIKLHLLLDVPLVHSSSMYRRELVLSVGGYDDAFARGPEDYELWARLYNRTCFANIPEPLVKVRLHSASATRSAQDRMRNQIIDLRCSILSSFLGRHVDFESAAAAGDLFTGFCRVEKGLHTKALDLLEQIRSYAARTQPKNVVRVFNRQIAQSVMRESMLQTYLDTSESKRLLQYALSICPLLAVSKYAIIQYARLFSPTKVRNCFRRAWKQFGSLGESSQLK